MSVGRSTCREIQRTLTGLASLEEYAAKEQLIGAHCRDCQSCEALAGRVVSALRALAEPASGVRPPVGFAARLAARLPERPSPLIWASVRLLPMTAALALTLLGWCVFNTPTPSEIWTAAGSEEILAWVVGEAELR